MKPIRAVPWFRSRPNKSELSDNEKLRAGKTPCHVCGALLASDNDSARCGPCALNTATPIVREIIERTG